MRRCPYYFLLLHRICSPAFCMEKTAIVKTQFTIVCALICCLNLCFSNIWSASRTATDRSSHIGVCNPAATPDIRVFSRLLSLPWFSSMDRMRFCQNQGRRFINIRLPCLFCVIRDVSLPRNQEQNLHQKWKYDVRHTVKESHQSVQHDCHLPFVWLPILL